MNILNLRLGFACNSSSTHSMIFVPPTSRVADDVFDPGGYGWENFTLVSLDAKRDYVATMLFECLRGEVGTDAAVAIVNQWVGPLPDGVDSYIDHQSRIFLPREFGKKGVYKEFIDEWVRFMMRDDLVILGGNDNSDGHPLAEEFNSFTLPLGYGQGLVARKDNGYWVIFNPYSGAKVRFSFDAYNFNTVDNDSYRGYRANTLSGELKPETPELIDVSLTDYCAYNCRYCYKGSTQEGQHAPMQDIQRIAYALHNLKVFEVALGGGDPTFHPNFVEILRLFRNLDIVPNFTTRNISWLKGEHAKEILDVTGAFAFSADSANDVRRLGDTIQEATGGSVRKAHVQVIEGVLGTEELRDILRAAAFYKLPVTILGYKETERGAEYVSQKKECDWLGVVQSLRAEGVYTTISIDTVLADRDARIIQESGVPEWMFTVREGQFSMYIDAPQKKIGPSSFCRDEEYVPVQFGYNLDDVIRENFARW